MSNHLARRRRLGWLVVEDMVELVCESMPQLCSPTTTTTTF